MKVRLDVYHKKEKVRRVVIKNDTMIGRGKDCSLRIASSQVSREHCKLILSGTEVLIRDLNSSNGTYVNGKKIGKGVAQSLNSKDVFSVGSYQFRVKFAPYVANDTTVHLPPDPVDIPQKRSATAAVSDDAAEAVETIPPAAEEVADDLAATVSPTNRNEVVEPEPVEAVLVEEQVAATDQNEPPPSDGLDNETPLVDMSAYQKVEQPPLPVAEPVVSEPEQAADTIEETTEDILEEEPASAEIPVVVEEDSAEIPVVVEDSAVELPVAKPLPVATPVAEALPADEEESPVVVDEDDDEVPVAVPEDEQAIELPVAEPVPAADDFQFAEPEPAESEFNFDFSEPEAAAEEEPVAVDDEDVEVVAEAAEETAPQETKKKKGGLFGLFGKKESAEPEPVANDMDGEDISDEDEAPEELTEELTFDDADDEELAFPDDEEDEFDPSALPSFDTEESAQAGSSDNDLNNFLNQLE